MIQRIWTALLTTACLLAQDPKTAFDRGNFAEAIRLFEAANRKNPDCANSFHIGLAHYRLKHTTEALLSFQAAVQCDPKLVVAHLALGNTYEERRNEGEAIAAYERVLALDPNNLPALRSASNLYLKNGLHPKALPLLESLVGLAPAQADARSDLGAVYAAGGNREGAEAQFRKALEIQPAYYPALSGLGNLLARSGENDAAMPLLRKAMAIRPKAYEAHFLLGSALNRVGKFDEARSELVQASKLGGGNEPQVFYQLARACGGLRLVEERRLALARFSELAKKEKESSEAQRQASGLVDEARTLLQSGNLEGAAQRLEQARELKPGDATLLFRLAGLHYDLQRFEIAREYVQAAIGMSPTTWLYHFLLGLVEKGASRLPDAKTSLETAARLNPSEAPIFNALGEVALQQNDRAAAIQHFEKACALAPGEETFRKNLELARQP